MRIAHFAPVLIVMLAPNVFAQSPSVTKSPAYEVISVKPDPSGDPNKPVTWSELPNGLTLKNVAAELMIRNAYSVNTHQIVGGPNWLDKREYDVEAKLDDAEIVKLSKMSKQDAATERQDLLRALLAERFALSVHRETREGRAFALVVAKGDPKFKEAVPDPKRSILMEGGTLTFKGASMPALVGFLDQLLGDTVIDRTELKGSYEFSIHWTLGEFQVTAEAPANATSDVSIATILPERLGLRLEPIKAPTEVVVIDHIAEPSPN